MAYAITRSILNRDLAKEICSFMKPEKDADYWKYEFGYHVIDSLRDYFPAELTYYDQFHDRPGFVRSMKYYPDLAEAVFDLGMKESEMIWNLSNPEYEQGEHIAAYSRMTKEIMEARKIILRIIEKMAKSFDGSDEYRYGIMGLLIRYAHDLIFLHLETDVDQALIVGLSEYLM